MTLKLVVTINFVMFYPLNKKYDPAPAKAHTLDYLFLYIPLFLLGNIAYILLIKNIIIHIRWSGASLAFIFRLFSFG